MRTLYGILQSPWTHRARWALDHHGVTYRYHEHVPMLGEVLLRRAAKTKKKTSVPLLVDGGGEPVMGSFEIARRAEALGRGAPLFPRDGDVEIARWNDVAERMSHVGRAWFMTRFHESRAAQREALPSFVPSAARALLAPTAAMAVSFLAKKHGVPSDAEAEVTHVLRPALEQVRAALAGKSYLLGAFSYADITVACALHALRPHDAAPLGPGTREAWSNEALAAEFDDLLMWRDAVVRKHR